MFTPSKASALTGFPESIAVAAEAALRMFMPLLVNAFFRDATSGICSFTSEIEKLGLNTGTSKDFLNGSVIVWFSRNAIALKSRLAVPLTMNGRDFFDSDLFEESVVAAFANLIMVSYGTLKVIVFDALPIEATLTPFDVESFVNVVSS